MAFEECERLFHSGMLDFDYIQRASFDSAYSTSVLTAFLARLLVGQYLMTKGRVARRIDEVESFGCIRCLRQDLGKGTSELHLDKASRSPPSRNLFPQRQGYPVTRRGSGLFWRTMEELCQEQWRHQWVVVFVRTWYTPGDARTRHAFLRR